MNKKVLVWESTVDQGIHDAVKASITEKVKVLVTEAIEKHLILCPGCERNVDIRHNITLCVNGRFNTVVWKLKQLELAEEDLNRARQTLLHNAGRIQLEHSDVLHQDHH